VFNHEFTDLDNLEQLLKELNYDLNFEEVSQVTFERPVDQGSLEKENLKCVNLDIFNPITKKRLKVAKFQKKQWLSITIKSILSLFLILVKQ